MLKKQEMRLLQEIFECEICCTQWLVDLRCINNELTFCASAYRECEVCRSEMDKYLIEKQKHIQNYYNKTLIEIMREDKA